MFCCDGSVVCVSVCNSEVEGEGVAGGVNKRERQREFVCFIP